MKILPLLYSVKQALQILLIENTTFFHNMKTHHRGQGDQGQDSKLNFDAFLKSLLMENWVMAWVWAWSTVVEIH